MKILVVALSMAALTGCYSGDSARRDEPHETPGEAAGRASYEIQKDAKKAAKELSKDLKSFGHDAKAGYEEQRRKDLERKKAHDAEDPAK